MYHVHDVCTSVPSFELPLHSVAVPEMVTPSVGAARAKTPLPSLTSHVGALYSDPCNLRPPIQQVKYGLKLKVVLN